MSKLVCKNCKSSDVIYEDYVGGTSFYRCGTCGQRDAEDKFTQQTIFDKITESPEVFAKAYCNEIVNGKGLCLIGKTGSGKSSRIEFYARKTYISVLSAQDACATWVEMGGDQNIPAFKSYLKADGREQKYARVTDYFCDLIIDDLGLESEKYTCYGTESDVMVQHIIPARYSVFPRWKTHFTTNLTKQQLRDRYGERCFSRLNEMCAFIPLTSGDRRLGR